MRTSSVAMLLGCAVAVALSLPVAAQKSLGQDPPARDKQVPTAVAQEAAWRAGSAWREFTARHGSEWQVAWNDATGTPKSVWGVGVALGDWRENSLREARRHAVQFLAENAELLGLGGSEFREQIGARMHRVWSFKFVQYHQGLEVLGGRADVRVHMAGRVPMFGSTFRKIPVGFATTPSLDAETAWMIAWQRLGAAPTGAPQPAPVAAPRLVVWSNADERLATGVQLAWEVPVSNVDVDGSGPIGRYYVDAQSGDVLEFRNDKHECGIAGCTGGDHAAPSLADLLPVAPVAEAAAPLAMPVATTVTVMGWTRTGIDALDPLVNVPLPGLELSVPGIGTVVTDQNGQFSIDIAAATTISLNGLNGRHHNTISGASAPTGSWTVNPGQAATIQLLSSGATTNQAAHTTTSYWVDATNEYSRSILGNTTQLNTASGIAVTVNIASTCNAYYTGNTINFYQAGGGCSNTSFSTVVAHEWGHGLDDRYGGISNATGDGLSEGWGDIFGCYLLDTPDLGSGFQTAGVPLRSGNNTTQYPCSGCGVHTAGQSWMGFAWKLRNRLAATYGNRATAIAISNDIVISTIVADAVNQADAVREVFVADDDDGNLANGTPNYNDLVWACNQHSLPYPGQSSTVPNDECATAIAVANGVSGPYSSVGAFTSAPAWGCASGGNDVWFAYTAAASGTLTVSTCSQAGWDTAIQVFSGSCGSLTSLGCNDDTCGTQSTVTANVTAGTYYIRVGGYNGATGAFSLNVTGPSATVPAAPSGLGATAASGTQIDLNWSDNASNETGYEVERSTDGSVFAAAATLAANANSWSDGGRAAGTTYWYRVRAVNGVGPSTYSNVASASTPIAPAAPTGLGLSDVASNEMTLTWADASNNETGFLIERSTNGSTFAQVASVGANVTTWTATGLAAATTYWFRVRATNAAGNSAYSNTASDTTLPAQVQTINAATGSLNHGTTSGALSNCNVDDGSYFAITERTSSGRNSLQYDWTFANVPSAGVRTLKIQAHRTVSADNDTFTFQVRVGNSYVTAASVTATSDNGTVLSYVLPSTVSGTVRVRVIDSDNRRNVGGNDTLFVDRLVIEVQ